MRWRENISAVVVGFLLTQAALGADAAVVSKLRAKFSTKKITVKGKLAGRADWPVGVKVAVVDTKDEVIASASDTVRAGESFQIELAPAKGQRFNRDELAPAQMRYWVRRGKKEEESGAVALATICPNLTKRTRWW